MPSISTMIIVFCGFGMLACLLGLGWACNALAVERQANQQPVRHYPSSRDYRSGGETLMHIVVSIILIGGALWLISLIFMR